MASRLDNISQLFSNFRTRSIIIVTLVILGLAILVGIIRIIKFSSGTKADNTITALTSAPTGKTVPGLSPTSPEYTQLQDQLNQQRLQEAAQTGGSSIPTITYQSPDTPNNSNADLGDGGNPAPAATAPVDPQVQALQQQVAQQNEQLQAVAQQQLQQASQDKSQAMRNQAQKLLSAWSQSPNQQLEMSADDGSDNTTMGGRGGRLGPDGKPLASAASLIKAGDIIFAVLDTQVNSDEPGPVMATLVLGPYKGAKLLGSLGNAKTLPGTNGAESLILRFSVMSFKGFSRSIGISAVAIDPDTARTALASDVDHHYMLRYGSLFASSFLEGYGNAASQAGSSTTQNPDGSNFTQYPDASPKREVASGFGQVGTSWGQQIGQIFQRPNTITVDAGTGVGILFLTDVSQDSTTQTQNSAATNTNKSMALPAGLSSSAGGESSVLPIEAAQQQLVQATDNPVVASTTSDNP